MRALIVNPAFDSQTKETLTLRASSFGSKPVLSEELMKKVCKTQLIDNILNWAKFKSNAELSKKDGGKKARTTAAHRTNLLCCAAACWTMPCCVQARISGIPKLDDANMAGGKHGDKCTLILTEGDSAKALAVSGLSVVGRDYYGVFPLKGKVLNVREANHTQIRDNAEINAIKQIMGFRHGMTYSDSKQLRYGHLMIMTDQDHDGSHIKGLLINMVHHFWPELLKVPGFLTEFITPIVKAVRGASSLVPTIQMLRSLSSPKVRARLVTMK